MRLKKVNGATEKVNNSKYVLLNPEDYKGNFNKVFDNDNPICIEIGMGKGDFIIGMSKKYPNINFIGLEKYDSVLVRAIEKLEDEDDLDNLKLICKNAMDIEEMLDKEIDTIYLNFSDPWPKKRHQNRRLTSEVFLSKYDNIFKNGKHIIMKTDNRHLFEYSIMSFTNYGYRIDDISLNMYEDDTTDNVPTEYEMKFHRLGKPIYKIEVSK